MHESRQQKKAILKVAAKNAGRPAFFVNIGGTSSSKQLSTEIRPSVSIDRAARLPHENLAESADLISDSSKQLLSRQALPWPLDGARSCYLAFLRCRLDCSSHPSCRRARALANIRLLPSLSVTLFHLLTKKLDYFPRALKMN